MANLRGTMQSQDLQRQEAPLRQGLMQQESQINQQAIEGEAHDRTIKNLDRKKSQEMFDKKLMETNAAATAFSALQSGDETQMMDILQREMPDFVESMQRDNKAPADAVPILKAMVDRYRVISSGKIPDQQKETISPELRRFREAGADPAFAASLKEADPAAKPTASEAKFNNYMKLEGMTEERAIKLTNGDLQVTVDPTLGGIMIVDRTNDTLTELTDSNLEEILQSVPDDDMIREGGSLELFSQIDETMTGAAPALQQFLQDTAGQVFDVDFIPDEVAQTRQMFSMQQKDLVRALQNSPRFTEGERQSIEKEIDIAPKTWTSAASLKSRLVAIDRSLRNRLVNERKKAKSPETNSKDVKGHLLKANIIEDFLRNLNVPQGGDDQSAEDEALIQKYL